MSLSSEAPLSTSSMAPNSPHEISPSAVFRTVEFTPGSGSAIDPLVEEASWFALRMASADPTAMSESMVRRTSTGFDCLVEAAWHPGRAVLISEVDWDPDRTQQPLVCRLALGSLGPSGTTRNDIEGLVARAEDVALGTGVFTAEWIDPVDVVPGLRVAGFPPPTLGAHAVHLAQTVWSLGDEADVIDVVSRFNPTIDPWSSAVDQLARLRNAVRVRATVLATELSPADRLEIENGLQRVRGLRERSVERPEVLFDADRAEATLLDLRASLSSPALVGEVAICSHRTLPDTLLRSIAASFTSQTDVLRQQGRVVVASNRLVLGGFELQRDPAGWAAAQAHGVPLRGGLERRGLKDLITLTESPIGWPLPWRGALPSIPRAGSPERPLPSVLEPNDEVETSLIGTTPRGKSVALPVRLRTQHLVATGTWGAGKSTLLFRLALDDLEAGRPLVFIDPHGTAADRLADFAAEMGVDAMVVDPADGNSDRIQLLPRLSRTSVSAAKVDAAIRRLADAIATSLLDLEWAGPRWYAGFEALLELVVVHRGELIDGSVWLNDPTELRKRLEHPDLSALSRSRLVSLQEDHNDVRGWITSKLHPLVSGEARHVVAPVGKGTDPVSALHASRPLIVNLAGLSGAEANLFGHLILAAVLDGAIARRPTDRPLVTCYVDEVQRFPARGLSRVIAEGRKFGVGLAVATQSLGQLSGILSDLAMGAGTHAVFRATPDTASRLASTLGLEPHDLMTQPDLQALVAVQGHEPTTVLIPAYPPSPGVRTINARRPASRSRSRSVR